MLHAGTRQVGESETPTTSIARPLLEARLLERVECLVFRHKAQLHLPSVHVGSSHCSYHKLHVPADCYLDFLFSIITESALLLLCPPPLLSADLPPLRNF